jgi:hypothetical protein
VRGSVRNFPSAVNPVAVFSGLHIPHSSFPSRRGSHGEQATDGQGTKSEGNEILRRTATVIQAGARERTEIRRSVGGGETGRERRTKEKRQGTRAEVRAGVDE